MIKTKNCKNEHDLCYAIYSASNKITEDDAQCHISCIKANLTLSSLGETIYNQLIVFYMQRVIKCNVKYFVNY